MQVLISPRVTALATASLLAIIVLGYQILFAATTTGTNFSIDGNVAVGNGTPTVTMDGEDAYVEGIFEVDGASRFDGAVTVGSGGITFSDASVATTASNVTKNFTVATGESITAGDVVGYLNGTVHTGYGFNLSSPAIGNGSASDYTTTAALDSTHFVMTYRDTWNSNYGTAMVGVVSSNAITFGAELVFESAASSYISVATLDSTHFVVAYRDEGNSNDGTAIVCVTDGATTISSCGSASVFNSATTNNITVEKLDSTHFVIGYQNDTGATRHARAIIGVTNGLTAISSFGSASTFDAVDWTDNISIAVLDATHFVAAFRTGSNSDGKAIVGLTNGATAISSFGTAVTFESAGDYANGSVSKIDSTHFAIGYHQYISAPPYYPYGMLVIGTTDGATSISSFGSAFVFSRYNGWEFISVMTIDATHLGVGFRDGNNSNYGTVFTATTNGTNAISSISTPIVFEFASTSDVSMKLLSASSLVIAYVDAGNSNQATAIIGNPAKAGPAAGIASASKTAGQTVSVITKGVSNVHSGLTAGSAYYGNKDGTLSRFLTTAAERIGTATSATDILFGGDNGTTKFF